MAKIAVDAVVFRDDLYPRVESSATTVQKYAEDLSVLPAIEVNQNNELIDGRHRFLAHKKREAKEIEVIVTETRDDDHLLELAIERNAKFGYQLSTSDKQTMARRIYRNAPVEERGAKKQRLAELLSMSYATINTWLGRIDKDTKEERDAAVQNLFLQCFTQQEIADAVGMPRKTVDDLLAEIQEFKIPPIPGMYGELLADKAGKALKSAEDERQEKIVAANREQAEHVTGFDPPIYNIWKQQTKSEGSSHFGNSEVRWVDNLLYLYTKPFDVVVDPFGGGGSTLDICRQRFRRCWISDRKPIEERAKEIRQLEVSGDSLPPLAKRWSEVKFVYLDPPYWKQAEGQYSDDPSDLGNMSLEDFNQSLAGVINGFAKKVKDAHIALIIQPTQWKSPNREFTDHIGDMLRAVKLPVAMRYSVPYESQQCTPQMVDWAKDNKQTLVLTREIVVWRVA